MSLITANWQADGGQQWPLPLGLGLGKIFHFGKLPVNAQRGACYKVAHPDDAPDWQMRLQLQFLFPR